MAQTRRAQILMEPDEYRQLEMLAHRQNTSVAELFRSAVRQVYLASASEKIKIAKKISSLSIDIPEWHSIENELAEAHDVGIH